MRSQEEELAQPAPLPIVDAARGWTKMGRGRVQAFGVVTDFDDGQGQVRPDDSAPADPCALRLHLVPQDAPSGAADRRLALQLWNDPDTPDVAGDLEAESPHQREEFSALNRSVREVDGAGNVAMPYSLRRVVDSHDGRHALALVIGQLELGGAETPPEPTDAGTPAGELPPGVVIVEAGSQSGTGGTVTSAQPRAVIQGLSVSGRAAVEAVKACAAAGGSAQDCARWALAANRGQPMPPLGPDARPPTSQTRPPPPDTNPGGSVAPGRPEGLVTDLDKHGLLSTFWTVQGTDEFYFLGSEGTPETRLALRHDAHVAMRLEDRDLTGAIRFLPKDASAVPRGKKPFKGELWWDPGLANQDTEVGLEGGKWVVVVPVDADLPPSTVPPDGVPAGDSGAKDGGGEPGGIKPPTDPLDTPKSPRPKPRGVRQELTAEQDEAATENPAPTSSTPDDDDPRDLPTPGANGQGRDFSSPGTPCPNRAAGDPLDFGQTRTRDPKKPRRGEQTGPGGERLTTGFPAVVDLPGGGIAIGGTATRGGATVAPPPKGGQLGAPAPKGGGGGGRAPKGGGGIVVAPPGTPQGPIPLGLGNGVPIGGVQFAPGQSDAAEEAERQKKLDKRNEDAARRRKEAHDRLQAEEQRLRDAAKKAREKGRPKEAEQLERRADRVKAADDRITKKEQAAADRKARLEKFEKDQRDRSAADAKARAERRAAKTAEDKRRAEDGKVRKYRDGKWVDAEPSGRREPKAGAGATLRDGAWIVETTTGAVSGPGFESEARARARAAGDL